MQTSPIFGVNLGGWLVLEKWITPSVFSGTNAVDEFTLCQNADAKKLQKLEKFRNNFITKDDFLWLSKKGVEAVRLPVGYWLFGEVSPYPPTVKYVDQAFEWAEATGIKIVLDLHAAPGSQNGKIHSGRAGNVQWGDEASVNVTLDILRRIANRYKNRTALLAISLLNEPSTLISPRTLRRFYESAYAEIRAICGEDVWIIFSDGFSPKKTKNALPKRTFLNVYIDMHHYQIFSSFDKQAPLLLSFLKTKFVLPFSLRQMRKYHPVIIGEWSLSLGYIGMKTINPEKRKKLIHRYGKLQQNAFRATSAQFYWTYKTENGGTWSFVDCVEKDLLDSIDTRS